MVIPAMVWFSVQSLNLEQARETDRVQTELARREAELQERISSALWRMDGFLTNLIARESTRPWYWYQAFYDEKVLNDEIGYIPNGVTKSESVAIAKSETLDSCVASPLLCQNFPYVKLYFEVDRNNNVTSPQTPQQNELSQALQAGLSTPKWNSNSLLKDQFAAFSDYDQLSASCLPELVPDSSPTKMRRGTGTGIVGRSSISQADENPGFRRAISPPDESDSELEQQAEQPESQLSQTAPFQGLQKQIAQQNRNEIRSEDEFSQRLQYSNNAVSDWQQNLQPNIPVSSDPQSIQSIKSGVMQPMWLEDNLLLVRCVKKNKEQMIQGCWLNWQRLQETLTEMVVDILPDVQMEPVSDPSQASRGQVLATLPVRLVIDRSKLMETLELGTEGDNLAETSMIRSTNFFRGSLWFAWLGLAFAAIGGGILLRGLLQLSERREAFVSAVSHELRTPLTTFRMYAEMLAEKMVPAEKQQQYANTLKVEAERLSHLVENVLQFARLDHSRQKTQLENATLGSIVARFIDRIETRAHQSDMEIVQEWTNEIEQQEMWTEPAAIEQILFNLVDNACKYAVTADNRKIILSAQLLNDDQIKLTVRDFGPGISVGDRRRLFRPFHKSDMEAANTAQGVGLGLALCQRMAKSLGGQLRVGNLPASEPGAVMELVIPLRS